MIKFWTTSGKYGCFSNFSRHPIVEDGHRFKTSEHYYQYHKPENEDDRKQVLVPDHPKRSKEIANSFPRRKDWEEVKFEIMLKALRLKAQQYEFIKTKLVETGEEQIAEDSPNDFIWGIGRDGTGQNLLGKAWMQVREELKNESKNKTA